MTVHIQNVTGTVHAVDGESLLTPQTMEQIVRAVMSAMDEKSLREKRAKSDTQVTGGIAQEQEGWS